MKIRTYISPSITVVEMSVSSILCGSLSISDNEINTPGRTKKIDVNGWGVDSWSKDNLQQDNENF